MFTLAELQSLFNLVRRAEYHGLDEAAAGVALAQKLHALIAAATQQKKAGKP